MAEIFYESVQEAARTLRKNDKEYLIVDHELKAGEEVSPDIHKANEWIIFEPDEGVVEITVGKKSKVLELNPERALVFLVKKGKRHSLKALTYVTYTVMRDGFD